MYASFLVIKIVLTQRTCLIFILHAIIIILQEFYRNMYLLDIQLVFSYLDKQRCVAQGKIYLKCVHISLLIVYWFEVFANTTDCAKLTSRCFKKV